MYLFTSPINSSEQLKSGNPCDRLIALCSPASLDIIVKIVVPTWGSLEAMALGRVVITTSIGLEGIPARHKEQVILANTVDDFLESIQQCYNQYPRIIKIGENAQHFVSNHFDSLKLAGKLIHAYKKVLNSHTHQ